MPRVKWRRGEAVLVVLATPVRSFEAALEILRDCSCILGMHPDQAACPIVEFAVKAGHLPSCLLYLWLTINKADGDGQLVSR